MTVQADDARLRMYLLGRFEVRAGDDVIIDDVWHHRNAKALLKLLAVQRDRSLHREQVLDAFWASLNPSAAGANLRKILFDLRAEFAARQVKAQVVTLAEDMVVLSPEIALDIDEFRSCARAARYVRLLADHIQFADQDFMVFGKYVRCSRSYACEKSWNK